MRNPLILASLGLAIISGCGGGGSGPAPLPISVSFSVAPPASLAAGATANVSATVLNDSGGKGVTWSCAPAAACGTFNPTSTTSGAATVFTAPSTVPTGGSVTITATSGTDSTKTTNQVVTITVIAVSMTTAPPGSMQTSTNANIVATVTNDSANMGVTWSCAPAAACGTFNPTSTASGAATVFTAPSTVPTGGSVTITATSVIDSTKFASAVVTFPLSVSFGTAPPSSLQTSGTANISAAVSNDPGNMGVTWSCVPMGSCGSFSVSPTASGAVTAYSAPATTPVGGSVTITATSVSDPTKTANATVKISQPASAATLTGHYAFLIRAPTGTRGTTVFIGSVNLDGKGNVLGGVEDVIAPNYNDQNDLIWPTSNGTIPNASHYTVDSSGHGTLRMVTHNNETLDVSFVVTSGSHALVIEADGNPGSGTLDQQQPTAAGFDVSQISGTYSFILDGVDFHLPPVQKPSIGGVFTSDGVAKLTNGIMDVNTGGNISSDPFTGTIDPPDPTTGRGQLTIFLPPTSNIPFRIFFYYLVSPKVLRVFEDDGFNLMGGSVYSQGAAGTTLSGNYVYRHSGWSAAGRTVAAGQFAATAAGKVTGGVSDANAGGSPTLATTGKAVSGSYTITATLNGTMTLTDAAGNSTFNIYMVDPTLNILDPNNTSGGGGALLLHTDANISGTGLLIPQSIPTSPTFTGNYALNLANSIAVTTPDELDLVGVMTGDGSANFINGLADYDHNTVSTPQPVLGAGLTGSFAKDSANTGRFTGNLSVAPTVGGYPFIPGAASPTVLNVSYYQANGSQAFVVETDMLASIEGTLIQLQLP
jgi:hypothetical protein